ncbi:MAG: hypothetical protein R2939_22835 [Kofleriaceae bacterium]
MTTPTHAPRTTPTNGAPPLPGRAPRASAPPPTSGRSAPSPRASSPTPEQRGRVARYLLSAPRLHLAVIVLLALGVVTMVVWRMVSVGALEREVTQREARAQASLQAQAGELLMLSATPLAWVVRTELMADDLGDIDAYLAKLVDEPGVERIVVVGDDDLIVASTDLKLEGASAATALDDVELAVPAPVVEQVGDELRLVVPVMAFDRQIATLVLDYAPRGLERVRHPGGA